MISLLYRVAVSLSPVVVGALFYLFSHGKKLESTVSPIKGTYRVRHIPTRYRTGEDSRRLIEAILSGPGQPCTIKARSFASNIDHNPTRKITTRTLTFDLDDGSPFTLQPNPENEWTFRAFDSESQENDDYLIVDTHFVGFTVLSCPEDDDHRFDLIAISGLGSHAWGSFKKRCGTSMWLVDKLPGNWSQARIMIYGYRSPIMGTASRQTLHDISKTFNNGLSKMRRWPNSSKRCVPIVLLAHSLGGLVIKQALLYLSKQSQMDEDSQNTFQSVYTMLFFGVPCKGLDVETLGLAAMANGQSTEGFLSDLRNNSPMVDDLTQSFLNVFDSRPWVEIYSFHETVASRTAVMINGKASMSGPKKYWIGKDAAFNGRDIERKKDETYSIPIHTDHSGLVKCDEEETFTTISNVLERIDWNKAKNSIETCKSQRENIAAASSKFQKWTKEGVECMKGLGPSTYIQDKDFNPDRVEGTCEWFLRHQLFTEWHKSGDSRLLWVSGDPGCGKSVLSKYLVDEKLRKTDNQSTCYYFFKDLPGRNNAATALKAILHQLFDQHPILLKYVVDDLNRTEAGFIHTFESYWDILLKAARSSEAHNIICILDALDECQDSGLEVIGKLNHFYNAESQNSKPSLKFLVTSRPYRDIEQKFVVLTRSMPTIRLAGEEAQNANAISREVNPVIDFNIDNMPWGDETKSQLRAALQAPSNRTYLWVSLVLEVLDKELKLTSKNATSIVNNLPQTVGHAYEAMLNKSPDKSLARKLLYMVLFAERPMTLAEMNIALNITDGCKSFEDIDRQDTDELLKTQIRTLCGLFLSIVGSKIYLIHQTAKEFLISAPEIAAGGSSNYGTLPLWESTFVPYIGHQILARACISYLFLFEDDTIPPRQTKHAFLNYSARYWTLHFREAKVTKRNSEIAKSALALCDIDSKRYGLWNGYIKSHFYMKTDFGSSTYEPYGTILSNLGLAAILGHTTTIELLLLSEGTDVNAQSSLGYTPLTLASLDCKAVTRARRY